jgi:2-keto-4-pentenoate hydratase
VQGIGAQIGELSLDDAYAIQDALLAERLFAATRSPARSSG